MNRAWTVAFWVMWALLLASWILALCGLSSLQNNCYADPAAALADVQGVQGFTNALSCHALYRLYWWYIAFLCVTLAGLLISAVSGWLVASALSWMAWLVVLSALYILAGDAFLGLRDISSGTSVRVLTRRAGGPFYRVQGVWWSRASTAAAGFILSSIFTLGLSFLLGWRQRRAAAGAGPIKV